jgi:hypothetical protein
MLTRRVSVALISLLASGCFISAGHIEIPNESARALLVLKRVDGSKPRVFAVAIGGGKTFISFPRPSGESFELFVLSYGCKLDVLGLAEGEIPLGEGPSANPLPSTPRPIRSASVGGGDPVFREIASLPPDLVGVRIVAPDVKPACCPPLLSTSTISVSLGPCQIAYCTSRARRDADECSFSIDLSACAAEQSIDGDFGTITGSIDPSGGVHLDVPPPPVECSAMPALPHAAASLTCDAPRSCGISVFTSITEPLFEVKTATVIPDVHYESGAPGLYSDLLQLGYLAELAILPDRAVVSSFGGAHNDSGERACTVPTPTTLHFLDLETMEEIGTAMGPPCLTRIVPSRTDDGFIGLSSHPSADRQSTVFELGRYTKTGAKVFGKDFPIPLAVGTENFAYWSAGFVETLEDPPRLAALFGAAYRAGEGHDAGHDYLDLFRTSDFEHVAHYDLRVFAHDRPTCVHSLAAVPTGTVAWTEDNGDFVRWLDQPDRALIADGDPGEIAHHPMSDRVLVPSSDRFHAMFAGGREDRQGGVAIDRVFPYERDIAMFASIPWPSDPSLAISAGSTKVSLPNGGREAFAVVELFDPGSRSRSIAPRFVPGSQLIGQGIVRRLIADAKGRVWMLLPWTGHVVRVEPRKARSL